MTSAITATDTLLDSIPDWSDWEKLHSWLQSGLHKVTQITKIADSSLIAIDGASLIKEVSSSPFGLYAQKSWRQFAAATFLADLACYKTSADQVNFERLLFVLHTFPQGFRTWGVTSPSGEWLPVGYSGFYPIAESTFVQLERADPRLASRLVIPLSSPQPKGAYLYLFNYSLITPLQKSYFSKCLLTALAQDLDASPLKGIATITVSQDGIRVAERFGLKITGTLAFENLTEFILTKKF